MFYDRDTERRVMEQLARRQAITLEELVSVTGEAMGTVRVCLARLVRQERVDVLRPLSGSGSGSRKAPRHYRLRRETDREYQWEMPLFQESRALSTWGSSGPGSLWELRCLERYA